MPFCIVRASVEIGVKAVKKKRGCSQEKGLCFC